MNITLLYNAVGLSDSAADRDVLAQVDAVDRALRSGGHRTRQLACTLNLAALEASLTEHRPDVVFNLVESLAGSDRRAHLAAALLDDLDLPYTGTPAPGLHLTTNKPQAKARLRAAGLPTPDWVVASAGQPAVLAPPYIIKAVWEHGSTGLDDGAVIATGDSAAVVERIASRTRQLAHPCYAEQFIDGREFNLSLIADGSTVRVLPPAEIEFSAFPAGKPRIVGYAAKWRPETFEAIHTPRRFALPSADGPLLDGLKALALDCWRLFELVGYARVDFRVDPVGRPWILDINANPCLAPDAGFVAALARADIPLARALQWIVDEALRPQLGAGELRPPTTRRSPAATGQTGRRVSATTRLRAEVQPTDRSVVRSILAATGRFRPEEIDVAVELVEARLAGGPASGYEFVFAEREGHVVGYACFGKNSLTLSSFDLYWIAVHPGHQGQGIGRQLLEAAECRVRAAAGARIYIDTSRRPEYQATRGFYERRGYRLESILEDFYGPGDSKAIYVKVL